MATSIVAYGTVKKYALRGLAMPEGWFVSAATGAPITDPNRSGEGLLLPMGEYKGSGLALMIGLLAGVLNSAAFGRDVVDFNADDDSETNTGHFMVAIDVARFLPLAAFTAAVDRHVRDLRQSKRLPGVDEIRLPGDRRSQCRDERMRDGVPIARALLAQLDKLAGESESNTAARAVVHDWVNENLLAIRLPEARAKRASKDDGRRTRCLGRHPSRLGATQQHRRMTE